MVAVVIVHRCMSARGVAWHVAGCEYAHVQVELMWQKFGPGIWEALAKKYTDIDMNQVSIVTYVT